MFFFFLLRERKSCNSAFRTREKRNEHTHTKRKKRTTAIDLQGEKTEERASEDRSLCHVWCPLELIDGAEEPLPRHKEHALPCLLCPLHFCHIPTVEHLGDPLPPAVNRGGRIRIRIGRCANQVLALVGLDLFRAPVSLLFFFLEPGPSDDLRSISVSQRINRVEEGRLTVRAVCGEEPDAAGSFFFFFFPEEKVEERKESERRKVEEEKTLLQIKILPTCPGSGYPRSSIVLRPLRSSSAQHFRISRP